LSASEFKAHSKNQRDRNSEEHVMPTLMTRFMKNRAGSTAIEYALIGTLVSIMIISGVALVAGNVGEKFNDTATQFEQATNR